MHFEFVHQSFEITFLCNRIKNIVFFPFALLHLKNRSIFLNLFCSNDNYSDYATSFPLKFCVLKQLYIFHCIVQFTKTLIRKQNEKLISRKQNNSNLTSDPTGISIMKKQYRSNILKIIIFI